MAAGALTSLTCRRLRRRRFAVANSLEVALGAAVEGDASLVNNSNCPSALGVAGTCGELATREQRRRKGMISSVAAMGPGL